MGAEAAAGEGCVTERCTMDLPLVSWPRGRASGASRRRLRMPCSRAFWNTRPCA